MIIFESYMILCESYMILCESYMIVLDYFMVINIQIFYLGRSKTVARKPKEKITKESSKKATTSDKIKSKVVKPQPQPPLVKHKLSYVKPQRSVKP